MMINHNIRTDPTLNFSSMKLILESRWRILVCLFFSLGFFLGLRACGFYNGVVLSVIFHLYSEFLGI